METVKKRGRKSLPATEKKMPITIFVKQKNYADAFNAAKKVERKFNPKKND